MSLLESFLNEVPDPRRPQGRRYELGNVLLFTILAVLSGAFSFRKIQRFMKTHRERLNRQFGLNWKRAPAYTSIRDILHGLDEEQFEKAFRRHSQALEESEPKRSLARIACDGKVLKGSFDRLEDRKAAHLVSAFSDQTQIILGHMEVHEKSNEIPAIQGLIKELGLRDRVLTLDALHCQKKTVEKVVDSGNHMVVRVKGNQPKLLEIAQQLAQGPAAESTFSTFEDNHGRMELRDVTVFHAKAEDFDQEWGGLFQTVAEVFRRTTFQDRHGQWRQRVETAYYLSTVKFGTKELASIIRRHWGIENRLHYVRDVTFCEDASRIRKKPGIFARVRSFALNIMRKNKLKNISEEVFSNALNLGRVLQFEGVR